MAAHFNVEKKVSFASLHADALGTAFSLYFGPSPDALPLFSFPFFRLLLTKAEPGNNNNENHEIPGLQVNFKDIDAEHKSLLIERAEWAFKEKALQDKLDQAQAKFQDLESEHNSLLAEQRTWTEKEKELQDMIEEVQNRFDSDVEELSNLKFLVNEKRDEFEQLESRFDDLHMNLHSKLDKLNFFAFRCGDLEVMHDEDLEKVVEGQREGFKELARFKPEVEERSKREDEVRVKERELMEFKLKMHETPLGLLIEETKEESCDDSDF